MENLYESLGFKRVEFVENPYGIKIYLGTKDKDDWCVEIPKELAQKKYSYYKCNKNYVIYFVEERDALRIAEAYTNLAKEFEVKN